MRQGETIGKYGDCMAGLHNVYFSYGKRKILEGLSFSVNPGECIVLAGPNGSGKSTALAILAGVFRPDSGEVDAPGQIAYVPQGTALFEDMTVGDNPGQPVGNKDHWWPDL